jgi:NAD(P)-dependent dehydrogenase (short-subunit alcohol dehydrogenase family)
MFINISSFMGITTAVPLGSLYNMSKFALEGLTEGLYYELKPLNIHLRLIEQGGSKGNNFVDSVVWNQNPYITAYDELTSKLQNLMGSRDESQLDDPMQIVNAIDDLATGKSNQFRTVIGNMGNMLMNMRNSMPIEEYMEKMSSFF